MLNFFKRGFDIDEEKIISALNINFKTEKKDVINDLKSTFGEQSDFYNTSNDTVICQVPAQYRGLDIFKVRLKEISRQNEGGTLEKYCREFLYKEGEKWERINDKPTPTIDPINPRIAKDFVLSVIKEIGLKIDPSNYVWILKNNSHNPQGLYKSKLCDFLTSHTNPYWWDCHQERRDFCKVTERFKDDVVDWIPLKEGDIIKTEDGIEFIIT